MLGLPVEFTQVALSWNFYPLSLENIVKSILVVEDSPTEQRLIVSLLQQAGHMVHLTQSADEASQWLQKSPLPPDLIVLDIVMPGTSGLDFCRELRKIEEYSEIPIVFCSSKDKEFDRFWALRQGGNAFVTKPFSPNELVSTISQYLPQ